MNSHCTPTKSHDFPRHFPRQRHRSRCGRHRGAGHADLGLLPRVPWRFWSFGDISWRYLYISKYIYIYVSYIYICVYVLCIMCVHIFVHTRTYIYTPVLGGTTLDDRCLMDDEWVSTLIVSHQSIT